MIENDIYNPDEWIDKTRIKMNEDMQRLGQAEYDRLMEARINELVKQYNFKLLADLPSTCISHEIKEKMRS
jgi:hypothetical protein